MDGITIRRLDHSRTYTLDDIVATSLIRDVATKSGDPIFNQISEVLNWTEILSNESGQNNFSVVNVEFILPLSCPISLRDGSN